MTFILVHILKLFVCMTVSYFSIHCNVARVKMFDNMKLSKCSIIIITVVIVVHFYRNIVLLVKI